MGASDTINLTIPAKPDYIGVVRLTISGIASRMGFLYDDIEDIKVAVSEAITNAVQHAYPNKEDGVISIKIKVLDNRMDIDVADNGRSFNIVETSRNLKSLDSSTSFEQLNEGGLGLYLIETLMDSVSISSDSGVVVRMSKFLNKGEVGQYAGEFYSSHD
ncbi:MAG: anti-sigma B factor RsbW [Tuberibacillus sp.]